MPSINPKSQSISPRDSKKPELPNQANIDDKINLTNKIPFWIQQSQIPSGMIRPRHLAASNIQVAGDLYYSDGSNFIKLPIKVNQILSVVNGLPAWGIPQYSTTARNALTNVVKGTIIYNTSTNKLNVYTTGWEAITSA